MNPLLKDKLNAVTPVGIEPTTPKLKVLYSACWVTKSISGWKTGFEPAGLFLTLDSQSSSLPLRTTTTIFLWRERDLNPRHLRLQRSALLNWATSPILWSRRVTIPFLSIFSRVQWPHLPLLQLNLCEGWDSNPQSPGPQPGALPIQLQSPCTFLPE